MKPIAKIAAVVLLLVGGLIASDSGAVAQMRPFYFGLYGGYSMPENMSWQNNSTGERIDFNVDNAGVIGFKTGFILPQARMLALEFEYNHIFEHNYGPGGNSFVTETGDVFLDNFLFNLILRYPHGRIHPYVGAGIGFTSINLQNIEKVGGRSFYQEEYETSFSWQFLAGLNLEIAPNISADLTYRYFGTDPHLNFVDVKYRTSIVSAGLNFHF